jgi:16S rRNA A1518/A1519 N6-dimethyltransferase RsmA/KsgA/DIM1 with predicted DNA glycosylase/AP lyase activity
MTISNAASHDALGSTGAEHERLIWQAMRLAPLTERLFREAGIVPGQRILNIGSGIGDVTMLAAKLVGASGEVVGIERDSRSIARTRMRGSSLQFAIADSAAQPVSRTARQLRYAAGQAPS